MHGFTVDTMHASVRADGPAEATRVARLHLQVAPAVAAATVHHGFADELVLVRELTVPVRVSATSTDAGIRDAWVGAVVGRLADLVEHPSAGAVVRYPSLPAAALDAAAGLTSDDLGRGWAWQLAGICPDVSTRAGVAAGLLQWLEHHPWTIPHVLTGGARAGNLGGFLDRLGPGGVDRLGRACTAVPPQANGFRPDGRPVVIDAAVVHATAIARALQRDARARAHWRAEPRALAAIVCRVLVPAGPLADQRVALVASLLDTPPGVGALTSRPSAPVEPVGRSDCGRGTGTPDRSDGTAGDLADRTGIPDRAVGDPAHPGGPTDRHGPEVPAGDTAVVVSAGRRPSPDGPVLSNRAGLLYLLNALLEPEVFAAAVPDLPGRSLPWTLWQLGATLTGLADDPAVAVFAGQLPIDPPPEGPDPTTGEDDGLGASAQALAVALTSRLRRDEPAATVLAQLVDRRAMLEVVEGWAEATFDLDAVDLDIRLAGLDRDPGFVPFLGTVVRFRYV